MGYMKYFFIIKQLRKIVTILLILNSFFLASIWMNLSANAFSWYEVYVCSIGFLSYIFFSPIFICCLFLFKRFFIKTTRDKILFIINFVLWAIYFFGFCYRYV